MKARRLWGGLWGQSSRPRAFWGSLWGQSSRPGGLWGQSSRSGRRALWGQSCIFLAALALLPALPLASQGGAISLGGAAVHRSLGAFSEASGDAAYGSSTGLELEFGVKAEAVRLEASVELSALTGSLASAALSPELRSLDPGLLVLAVGADGEPKEAALSGRLRTLVLRLNLGQAALSVGKQIVNYGRGVYWSPVDLFADIDYSGSSLARRGTELARFRLPLGPLSGLDLVAAPRSDLARGRYAARLSGFLLGLDGGLLGAWEGERGDPAQAARFLVGADFKADLIAGIYGEVLYGLEPSSGQSSLKATAGLDWSIDKLYLAVEYYHHGGGAAADPIFPSPHYLYASAAYSLSDFLALSLSATLDLAGLPARAGLSCVFDAAQATKLAAFIDASRGSFAQGGDSLGLSGGLMLELRF